LSNSHSGIRTVLFDLDGTLRHNHPTYAETFFSIAARLGAPASAPDQRGALRWLHAYWARSAELMSDRARLGEGSEDFWINHCRLLLVALGCTPEQAYNLAPAVYQGMNDEYLPQDRVFPDVLAALEALKQAGYRLAVLSNRSRPYLEQLQNLDLAGYFEGTFHTGGTGVWKPDPLAFQQALDEMGVQPAETVYVGDNYYADVIGARAAGLAPVLLDPDGLFPEAECAVIRSIGELPELLAREK